MIDNLFKELQWHAFVNVIILVDLDQLTLIVAF